MTEAIRQAADRFLRETYGFDAATRTALIERGLADIARNLGELRQALADGAGEAARRLAHRLKGNLRALGLVGLAAQAQAVEVQAESGGGFEAAARKLSLALDPAAGSGES